MADLDKSAMITVRGKIDESLLQALRDVRAELEQIHGLARSIRVGTEATQAPPAARFPSLGSPATGALRIPSLPEKARAAMPPRLPPGSVPPSVQPPAPPTGGKAPSSTAWTRLAESFLPVERIVRQILRPGASQAGQAAGASGGPSRPSATMSSATGAAQQVEAARRTEKAVRLGAKAGVSGALGGILNTFRVARPTPSPMTPTIASPTHGGPTLGDRQAFYNKLLSAGATPEEARAASGMPKPPRAPSGTGLYEALGGASLVRSALGPLGALTGAGALAASTAYGLSYAPKAAALGMQVYGSPNAAYTGILGSPSVRRGIITPSEFEASSTALLGAAGRMQGTGQQAMLGVFRDAQSAARFARAIGIQPSTSATLLGAMEAAGIVAPGQASSAVGGLYGAATASGLPGGVFASGLGAFVQAVQGYSIPTASAALLSNTASFGAAYGIPALTGNRVSGTLAAYSGAIQSGSLLQSLPGPVLAQMLGALSPGGKTPATIGDVYRSFQGGMTQPQQIARFMELLRSLYGSSPATRNYAVLNQLLQPLGGYGSAQSTALEQNVLALPQAQYQQAMATLTKAPKAAPSALQNAVSAFQSSYGGSAIGIQGGLETTAAQAFRGLAAALNTLSGALRRLQGPVQAISVELAAGLGLSLLGGRVGGFFGGGGAGGAAGGIAGTATGGLLGRALGGAGGAAVDAAAAGGSWLATAAGAVAGAGALVAPYVAPAWAALDVLPAYRGVRQIIKNTQSVALLPGGVGPSVTVHGSKKQKGPSQPPTPPAPPTAVPYFGTAFAAAGIDPHTAAALEAFEGNVPPNKAVPDAGGLSIGPLQLHTPGGQASGYNLSTLLSDPAMQAKIGIPPIQAAYKQAVGKGLTGFAAFRYVLGHSGHPSYGGLPPGDLQAALPAWNATAPASSGTAVMGSNGVITVPASAPQTGEPLNIKVSVESGHSGDWIAKLGDLLTGHLNTGARGAS